MSTKIKNLPNEMLWEIVSYADPQAQGALCSMNHRFKTATQYQVLRDVKLEMSKFKEFIMEKAKTCRALYEGRLRNCIKNGFIPANVKPKRLIVEYLRDWKALESSIDTVFKDAHKISSLGALKTREQCLFQAFKGNMVIYSIFNFSPNILKEMQLKKHPCWLSGYNAFYKMGKRYAQLHKLISERNNVINNPNAVSEVDKKIIQERLLLTLDGYVGSAFDILYSLPDDAAKVDMLYLIMFSLQKEGLLSLQNIKKIIGSISSINNGGWKEKVFEALFRLPLTEEMIEEVYEKAIAFVMQNPTERVRFLQKLHANGLSEEKKDEILKARQWIVLETLKSGQGEAKLRVLSGLACEGAGLSLEEEDAIIQSALNLRGINRKCYAYMALCTPNLSQKKKEIVLNGVSHVQIPERLQVQVFTRLCQLDLSQEEKDKVLNRVLGINNEHVRVEILETFCKLDLSKEQIERILHCIRDMKELANRARVINALGLSEELQEYKANLLKSAQDALLTDAFEAVQPLKELSTLQLSHEEWAKIIEIAETLCQAGVYEAADILALRCGFALSQKDKEDILNIAIYHLTQQPEYAKRILRALLSHHKLSDDEFRKVVSRIGNIMGHHNWRYPQSVFGSLIGSKV